MVELNTPIDIPIDIPMDIPITITTHTLHTTPSTSTSTPSTSISANFDGGWLWEVVKFGVVMAGSFYFAHKTLALMAAIVEPANKAAASAAVAKRALAKRLNRPEIETMTFDEYESRLLPDIMSPDEIGVGFVDIGGMEAELEEIGDTVVLPMKMWRRFGNLGDLPPCPTGVLLYGAPGTGKSLTAKAIAKESGATFLNLKASSIMDKYLGETDKMVSAIFRLGRKLAPAVLFIDEIETVLKKRESGPFANAGLQSMQGVFLSEWDGLTQDNKDLGETGKGTQSAQGPVLLLGATNRPQDLDKAFLRRMPVQIQTPMPDTQARAAILRAQLQSQVLSPDVDLSVLAAAIPAFSGSDIRELVRLAMQQRAKSYTATLWAALAAAPAVKQPIAPGAEAGAGTAGGAGAGAGGAVGGAGEAVGGAGEGGDALAKGGPLSSEHFEWALQKTLQARSGTSEYGKDLVSSEFAETIASVLRATN